MAAGFHADLSRHRNRSDREGNQLPAPQRSDKDRLPRHRIAAQARGEAKVESKQGYIEIEVEFDNLQPATKHGPEYLTYVLWAITPEGRTSNLGEILLNGTKSKLNVTTELQVFALVVTAEPYYCGHSAQRSDRDGKCRARGHKGQDRRDRRQV